jgi:DNA ligase-1
MREFAILLERLALTPSRNRKIDYIVDYLRATPDPDRGLALAVLTNNVSFSHIKAGKLKDIVKAHVDEHLFKLSYNYVGDTAETIALIWPYFKDGHTLPSLSQMIAEFENTPKSDVPAMIEQYLTIASPNERWAMIKMATGGLRIGVSERLAKTALAKFGDKDLQEVEEIWHGLIPPYTSLFQWMDGVGDKPDVKFSDIFHPLMLSTPIDADKDFEKLDINDFQVEWKWDGIRVQLVIDGDKRALYSRTGDDISGAFPDITQNVNGSAVLDGELLVGTNFEPDSFNHLQQRLNRKTVTKKQMETHPAYINVYDMLFDGDTDIRDLPLSERRTCLDQWFDTNSQTRLTTSSILNVSSWDDVAAMRQKGADEQGHEGVMIKRKDSVYVPGRPRGEWFKWKRNPFFVDAIMMYGQRGHGKRSSYYSDYTFGVWDGNQIVPIGKAYSGFTDAELIELDKFVRKNTISKYGPVREVKKELVLEIAFDSMQESPRHKSGIALRFPRIHRIRWDKPAQEVQNLADIRTEFLT